MKLYQVIVISGEGTMRQFFQPGLWEGSSLQTLWRPDGRDRACRWATL